MHFDSHRIILMNIIRELCGLHDNTKDVRLSATVIWRVKSGKGKSYEVKWDQVSKDVYVSYAGRSHVSKTSSAEDTMNKE